MIVVALVLATASLGVSLLTLFAVAEMQVSMSSLREFAGYSDEPQIIPEVLASLYGVPAIELGLPYSEDEDVSLLFLSTKCLSCHSLASALGGEVPATLRIYLVAGDELSADAWLQRVGLSPEQVVVDIEGLISERIGITGSPSYLAIREGRFVDAKMISSLRALVSEIENGPPTEQEIDQQFRREM